MKKLKLIKRFIAVAIVGSAMTLTSCDALLDDNETDFGEGPILAQFASTSTTANFLQDGSVTTYNIPIAIIGGDNEPIDTPVDITISVDPSSTATANEFSLDQTTYTIEPGDLSVNAQISVPTDNLDPFDPQTLVLRIDSSSQGVSESNTTSIVLQAVCPLDLNNFVGSYTAVTSNSVVDYTSTSNATIELGPAPNSLLITDSEGQYANSKVLVVLNTDVVDPTITYASEEYDEIIRVHPTYGGVWATTLSPDDSSYNSCDFSLSLEYKWCVGAGCFGGTVVTSLTKN
ncbi:hypothetical protein [Winogradskyella bathintestinalis]|uniref:DUF1735 domain-containing protein n=1 Tax=Winogradskyella bathintestinalis TaxID=3035208 RepID=A0ABT7ZUJ2_9FLAO|nr:hypothetical protein [Winogradskyella bathintestinalis]MDN3492678.1 hypothetical protein [Winogradskyella bathintestinalis]